MNLTHLRKLAERAKSAAKTASEENCLMLPDQHYQLAEALDRALDALEQAVKQRRSFCQSSATNNDLDYGLQRCLDGGEK